ncbi:hypothetical protein PQQ51_10990 [Paraburkholderia xenovorans]|uniref:hypothetical protein n=1 Tax=Paraburkholderia xenovorans TaxID=36873 RepID=UPI0038B8430D
MRVVYFCTAPALGKHAGGVKVIYDHCRALNETGIDAVVLHERRGYEYPWAEHAVPTIAASELRATDHLVLPEIKAAACARLLVDAGVQYSIFVQNGYYVSDCGGRHTSADASFAYANATAILSISSDTTDLIMLHYPELAARVVGVQCSIDANEFAIGRDKRNVITYMPRKNGRHAAAVAFALERRLPAGWRLQAIDGMSEREVAHALRTSRIFMSFSDLEGLGLPPIEAALCGNYVIGYHGGGGRDYWRAPNFEAVEAGDIGAFVKRVIARAESLGASDEDTLDALLPGIDSLSVRYSRANERLALQRFRDVLRAGDAQPEAAPEVRTGKTRLRSLAKLQRRPKLSWRFAAARSQWLAGFGRRGAAR